MALNDAESATEPSPGLLTTESLGESQLDSVGSESPNSYAMPIPLSLEQLVTLHIYAEWLVMPQLLCAVTDAICRRLTQEPEGLIQQVPEVFTKSLPDGSLWRLFLDVFTQTKFEGSLWEEQIKENKVKLPKAFLYELVLRYIDKERGNPDDYPEYTGFHDRDLCQYHDHHNIHDDTTDYFKFNKPIVDRQIRREQAPTAASTEESPPAGQSPELQARDNVEPREVRADEVMVESSIANHGDVRIGSPDNLPTAQTDQGDSMVQDTLDQRDIAEPSTFDESSIPQACFDEVVVNGTAPEGVVGSVSGASGTEAAEERSLFAHVQQDLGSATQLTQNDGEADAGELDPDVERFDPDAKGLDSDAEGQDGNEGQGNIEGQRPRSDRDDQIEADWDFVNQGDMDQARHGPSDTDSSAAHLGYVEGSGLHADVSEDGTQT